MSGSADISITNLASAGDDCEFVRENAAAFALQSLTGAETARIVQHLLDHPACQQHIDDALAVAQVLPYSMPLLAAPDVAVKFRLFDRIAADAQTPVSPPVPDRFEHSQRILRGLNPAAHPEPPTETPAPFRQPAWTQHLSTILVAPLCVALLVMSLWAYNLNDELDSMQDELDGQQGQTVSNSMELYSMTSSCKDCSTGGQIGTMPDQKSAVLLAWDLNPDEKHEIWCEESNGEKWMVSQLDVNANGAAMQTIKFPKPIDGYKRIFVSGVNDAITDAPELLVAIPEDHDDESSAESTPTA
jgi:hypothetical protein